MPNHQITHTDATDFVSEQELLGEVSTDLPQYQRVVIFAPHPDDEVFGAGGTLQRLASSGVDIHQIIITSGDHTSDGENANIRRVESRKAAQCLGLPEPIFWDFPDRTLTDSPVFVERVQSSLKALMVDAVMVPGLDEVHPDHRATTQVVTSIIQSEDQPVDLIFYEISRPIAHPNWFVDISRSEKCEAMQCFRSQQAAEPYAERIYGLNQYRSYHLGSAVKAAEAFLKVSRQTVESGHAELGEGDWDARLLRLEHQNTIKTHLSQIRQLEGQIRQLQGQKRDLDYEIRRLNAALTEIQQSSSWKITRPLRKLKTRMQRLKRVLGCLSTLTRDLGGMTRVIPIAIRVIRQEGLRIFWWRIVNKLKTHQLDPAQQRQGQLTAPRVIPYYLDPGAHHTVPSSRPIHLAVHLHLFHLDQADLWVSRLNSIQRPFDLFISISETDRSEQHPLNILFKDALNHLNHIQIQAVPNRGRDLAPMIITFGKQLQTYQVVGHFHSKVSPHNRALSHWRDHILDLLLGAADTHQQSVEQIMELIATRASVVYPEAFDALLEDHSGWGGNWDLACEFCERHGLCDLTDYPSVEFPRGSMFWARTTSLAPLLNLPLEFKDFPTEPIATDGTLAHALERLLLVVADQGDGQLIRLHRGDSLKDKPHYESPMDFSHLPSPAVRALAFYLPQFHSIPENDLWHGEGFTEWTKVRASTPLFTGHHQQHRPHPDIGYYLLNSPEPLKYQANLLSRSGLAGMVFYHYWFSGKLILEEPAQMLLAHPEISMPFAFCWANENWTRRWDGNTKDVLLEQIYSAKDAKDFITYLIPFFKDPRYLCVNQRPILLIYRPADLPKSVDYIGIWSACCEASGIAAPYCIGVLTRGASQPAALGMEAGLERVLHDWGGGAIPELKNTVDAYQPLHGSILEYNAVAAHYEANRPVKDATVFRSVIPQWDNTPRYGDRANVVHGSTPTRYEQWLRQVVEQTQHYMEGDERLIFINAWNEWAEGAHLEPDTQFGYAYLNATGRAVYGSNDGRFLATHTKKHLEIQIEPSMQAAFSQQWSEILLNFKALQADGWTLYSDIVYDDIRPRDQAPRESWFLQFRAACLLTPDAIITMFKEAASRPDTTEAILLFSESQLPSYGPDGQISRQDAFNAPILLHPPSYWTDGIGAVRAITGTPAFAMNSEQRHQNAVTLVVRFHNGGSLDLLAEALTSIAAQKGANVSPLIALQSPTQMIYQAVTQLVSRIAWPDRISPQIKVFDEDNGDLRSVMLNESLQSTATRYVGFLDHDDLLLPDACHWRIERLKQTGSAVTFGRIYNTRSDKLNRRLLDRGRLYEYNRTYEEFLVLNHCPLHGVLLDRHLLSGKTVIYRPQQRYLEDYALLLQVVSANNTDWGALALNHYVGDYRHLEDGDHTLALSDPEKRAQVLESAEYLDASNWIQKIQNHLRSGNDLETLSPPKDGRKIVL